MGHFVFDAKGQILKCTCNLDGCIENVIGQCTAEGNWQITSSKYAVWLNEKHSCEENCFFAPVCLGESCPASRAVHGIEDCACPHEKNNIRGVMLMLDAHNQLFPIKEELINL
jgi:hypothetical protein